jgi:hypothetical protein
MATRFKRNETAISFEVAGQAPQTVALNRAGAIFAGQSITPATFGIHQSNVKYAGPDFLEHDAIVYRKLEEAKTAPAQATAGATADEEANLDTISVESLEEEAPMQPPMQPMQVPPVPASHWIVPAVLHFLAILTLRVHLCNSSRMCSRVAWVCYSCTLIAFGLCH